MSTPSKCHGLAISLMVPSPASALQSRGEPMGTEEQGWAGVSPFTGLGRWD